MGAINITSCSTNARTDAYTRPKSREASNCRNCRNNCLDTMEKKHLARIDLRRTKFYSLLIPCLLSSHCFRPPTRASARNFDRANGIPERRCVLQANQSSALAPLSALINPTATSIWSFSRAPSQNTVAPQFSQKYLSAFSECWYFFKVPMEKSIGSPSFFSRFYTGTYDQF